MLVNLTLTQQPTKLPTCIIIFGCVHSDNIIRCLEILTVPGSGSVLEIARSLHVGLHAKSCWSSPCVPQWLRCRCARPGLH